MLKILTLVGARPQFIKSAAISRAIRGAFSNKIEEILVHSGQHFDSNMSSVFFQELNLPTPNYQFELSAIGQSEQIAEIVLHLEKVINSESPDAVLVYGDTNTTLAGALVASKNKIPLIHVEAGLRSFNKTMPEEINRILTDHCSTLLFCPTQTAIENLKKESIVHTNGLCDIDHPGVYMSGDVMYDNSLYFSEKTNDSLVNKLKLNHYVLFTLHRASNTDDSNYLVGICFMLIKFAENYEKEIVFPIHPRTKKALKTNMTSNEWRIFSEHKFIKMIEPVSFLDMISLEKNCDMVITDSGGVQKEAYFFEKPCLILRSETEWVEIVEQGVALLVDANYSDLSAKYDLLKSKKLEYPSLFGDGNAAEFICNKIISEFS